MSQSVFKNLRQISKRLLSWPKNLWIWLQKKDANSNWVTAELIEVSKHPRSHPIAMCVQRVAIVHRRVLFGRASPVHPGAPDAGTVEPQQQGNRISKPDLFPIRSLAFRCERIQVRLPKRQASVPVHPEPRRCGLSVRWDCGLKKYKPEIQNSNPTFGLKWNHLNSFKLTNYFPW